MIDIAELKARVQTRAALDAREARQSLLKFVPSVHRKYVAPKHLTPLANAIERTKRERVRAVVSAPPRHGKTELELAGIAWLLRDDPAKQIALIGYAQRFAEKKSRKARDIARRIGVPMADDSQAKADWRTGVDDGGLWATGIDGQLTGEGFHCMFIDDPVKGRKTAESRVMRDNHYDWFTSDALSRLEPNGSCILTMTRWHADDLGGRLIKDGWEHIVMPAINDAGHALWPERWPIEILRKIEADTGEYNWASLYQGRPFPRGGAVFRDAWYFEGAVPTPFKISIGADFAYSADTKADYSTIVVLAEDLYGNIYVLEVWRKQVESPEHAAALRDVQGRYGVPIHAYIAGIEKGVVSFMINEGVKLIPLFAVGDKFSRAQPVAARWNHEKVLLAYGAKWAEDFIAEVCGFTGVKDPNDDQVDALAAAFDALHGMTGGVEVTIINPN